MEKGQLKEICCLDMETFKEQGYLLGNHYRYIENFHLNIALAVEFLHSKFGRHLNLDSEEHNKEDLTQLV